MVITFLSRSKSLLISWLQSPFTVILEPRKIKAATVSPSICHEVMGPDANPNRFLKVRFAVGPMGRCVILQSNNLSFLIYRSRDMGNICGDGH